MKNLRVGDGLIFTYDPDDGSVQIAEVDGADNAINVVILTKEQYLKLLGFVRDSFE